MKGLAAMRRRIKLTEWEGHWPSQNAESIDDGAIAAIILDDREIGVAFHQPCPNPYHFELGDYPEEEYHGNYRTENAMLDALARTLIEQEAPADAHE